MSGEGSSSVLIHAVRIRIETFEEYDQSFNPADATLLAGALRHAARVADAMDEEVIELRQLNDRGRRQLETSAAAVEALQADAITSAARLELAEEFSRTLNGLDAEKDRRIAELQDQVKGLCTVIKQARFALDPAGQEPMDRAWLRRLSMNGIVGLGAPRGYERAAADGSLDFDPDGGKSILERAEGEWR